AIGNARAGDVVVLAGKGHEDYQEVGDRRLPFSDRGAAEAALSHWSPA
ncbi:MAG TPA: UDP-N-acetylmuramoylalanyl-D-glutamate--2,6-diaminopimelate ligase, partial [Casimicrobiaceae bacterium]|nr:UDP-N-acetylmuramoylalanyl-D-glutamate--2,6-diaminopimelate ligase [Casimicrobiaceae bacterium]